jgi:hypothetical protein
VLRPLPPSRPLTIGGLSVLQNCTLWAWNATLPAELANATVTRGADNSTDDVVACVPLPNASDNVTFPVFRPNITANANLTANATPSGPTYDWRFDSAFVSVERVIDFDFSRDVTVYNMTWEPFQESELAVTGVAYCVGTAQYQCDVVPMTAVEVKPSVDAALRRELQLAPGGTYYGSVWAVNNIGSAAVITTSERTAPTAAAPGHSSHTHLSRWPAGGQPAPHAGPRVRWPPPRVRGARHRLRRVRQRRGGVVVRLRLRPAAQPL